MVSFYVVGKFDDHGNHLGYVMSGRPFRITGYDNSYSAERAIKQKKDRYNCNLKVLEITDCKVVG